MKKTILFIIALLVINSAFAKRIKFQVNMTGQTISSNGVHLAGGFQGWNPATTLMTNGGSGNIYSVILNIPAKVVLEYKFINGNTWGDMELTPTITRVGSVINGNFNDNRWFYLDSLANDTTIVPAVLFSGSAPIGLRAVRFAVEFQNSTIINSSGVHIAGDFQGWNPASTRMSNLYTSNKIYEYITYLDTNFHEFKYINGNAWGNDEIVPSACSNVGGGNRLVRTFVDVAINKVCFSRCNACNVTPQFSITFKVDMLNADCLGGFDSVTIAGNNIVLTNWGSGIKLTQVGTTSIYAAQVLMDSSVIQYKFRFHKNGITNWEGNNNRTVALIKDTVLASVCFGNINGICTPKPAPSTVTFKVDLSNEVPDPNGKIYVMGTFTNPNWQSGAIRLAPSPGQPGIYFANVPNVCWGSFNYIFYNGDSSVFSNSEMFPDTNQRSCLTPNGVGGFNRTYTRTSANPVTLFYQFNKCTPCFFNTTLSIADTVVAYKQDSVLLNAGSGYSKYKWSRGDSTQSIWVKTSGNYNITVSNLSGCIYTKSIAVFFVKGIQQKDTSICLGKSLNLNVQGASKVLWSTNDTTNSITVTPTLSTTYRCTQRIGSFVMIDSVRITVNSLLNIQRITSSDSLSFCGLNSKFLIGVTTNYIGTKNYLWYKNDTLLAGKTLAMDTFTSAGKYKVTLTTPTGCYQEQTFYINKLNSFFNLDFASNKQNATTTPFDFTFSNNTTPLSDYNFTWSWGDGNTSQNNNLINFYTYTSNGTYSVKLVAQNKLSGCKDSIVKANYITCSGGSTGVLALNTNKTNPICYGETNGSITVNVFGGTTPYQYKLNTGSYQSNNIFSNLGAGIYTVYVKDATNTIISKTDTLINPAVLAVGGILGSNGVPVGSTQNYNIASQNGVIYTWNIINGTLLSGNGTNSIQVQWAAVSGMGKVIANIAKNSCSSADTLVVSIGSNPLTLSTIKTDETCAGKANGAITINAAGGTTPYLYAINNGTYQPSNTFSNLVAGIYVSKVKDASNVISQKTDTINVGVGITAGAMNGPTNVALNALSTYLIAQQTGATMAWTASNGIVVGGQGTNIAQVSWGATAGLGIVKVKVTSAAGCIDSTILDVTIGSTNISSISSTVNALKVYPNPASTLLHIDLEKPGYYTAKLSSVAGQSVISPTTGTIDIAALANGVYILTIFDSNNKLISTNKVAIVK
jgi:hypothetical protein